MKEIRQYQEEDSYYNPLILDGLWEDSDDEE